MKKIKTFGTFLVFAAVSTSPFAEDKSAWPESFTVGTGSQGGTYFGYGTAWANIVSEETGVTGGAEVTGGPMQNMALVHTRRQPVRHDNHGPCKGIT